RTRAPTAISIITTSTIARCSFTRVSLPSVGKGQVLRVGSVTSTQDIARELPVGSIVVADHQSAGRGRLDRRWEAPPGTALLGSVVPSRHRDPVLRLSVVAVADPAHASVDLLYQPTRLAI